MIYKNQILVFIISFLIAGFFVLSTPESGISQPLPGTVCCDFPEDNPPNSSCAPSPILCQALKGIVCESGLTCTINEPCTCPPPPPIPSLNQWGMVIMAAVLGLFAVIGLFVMRRSGVAKPSN